MGYRPAAAIQAHLSKAIQHTSSCATSANPKSKSKTISEETKADYETLTTAMRQMWPTYASLTGKTARDRTSEIDWRDPRFLRFAALRAADFTAKQSQFLLAHASNPSDPKKVTVIPSDLTEGTWPTRSSSRANNWAERLDSSDDDSEATGKTKSKVRTRLKGKSSMTLRGLSWSSRLLSKQESHIHAVRDCSTLTDLERNEKAREGSVAANDDNWAEYAKGAVTISSKIAPQLKKQAQLDLYGQRKWKHWLLSEASIGEISDDEMKEEMTKAKSDVGCFSCSRGREHRAFLNSIKSENAAGKKKFASLS